MFRTKIPLIGRRELRIRVPSSRRPSRRQSIRCPSPQLPPAITLAEPLHAYLARPAAALPDDRGGRPAGRRHAQLARCLADAGVPHGVRECPGTVHDFLQMTARSAAARRALAGTGRAIGAC